MAKEPLATGRAFHEARKEVQALGEAIAEPTEIARLRAAAARCSQALDSRDAAGLAQALRDAKAAVHPALVTDALDDAAAARKPNLDRWRPAWSAAASSAALAADWQEERPPGDSQCDLAVLDFTAAPAPAVATENAAAATALMQVQQSWALRKASADEAVRCGDYSRALVDYEVLLDDMSDHASCPEDVRVAVLSNAGLCTLKLSPDCASWNAVVGMLRRTLDFCSQALSIDAALPKAHFRRGCALEALEHFEEAYRAYEQAASFAPDDPKIRGSLDRIVFYEESELGKELFAEVAERRALLERRLKQAKRQRGRLPQPPTSRLTACVACGSDASTGDHFAAPCGHGPFCRDCRARMAREGRGLEFCAARLCGQIVEHWTCGGGAPLKQAPRQPPAARPSLAEDARDIAKQLVAELKRSEQDLASDAVTSLPSVIELDVLD